jgi:hypothetical protein
MLASDRINHPQFLLPVNENGGNMWPRKCGAEFQISNEKLDLGRRSINMKGGGDYRVRARVT